MRRSEDVFAAATLIVSHVRGLLLLLHTEQRIKQADEGNKRRGEEDWAEVKNSAAILCRETNGFLV